MNKSRTKRTLQKKTLQKKTLRPKYIIVDSFSSPQESPKNKTNLKKSQQIIHMTASADKATFLPSNERLNEKFIDLLEKLSEIMQKQGEPFRARAYQKAQETIMAYPVDIVSPHDLKGKPGIGDTIMEKLNEYVKTGTLLVLEREKNNPINAISEVYGIGPKKAKELVDKGIDSIEKLREKQNEVLNDTQRVGLKYYEDILRRIPRTEIDEYADIFNVAFNKIKTLDSDSRFEIVGSYRRGAQSSGDIDVIITTDSPVVFTNFIDILIKQGIILEVLSRGQSKCLVITKIPSSEYARRVDFLYASKEEYPFSVLYFTGSKIFNTVMRHRAQTMGFTMNEHGLYKMEGKQKGEKVAHIFKTEQDIFDYLQLEYKTPVQRTDGRAVIVKKDASLVMVTSPEIFIEKAALPATKMTTKKTLKKKENGNEGSTKTKKKAVHPDTLHPDTSVIHSVNDFKKNGIRHLNLLNEEQLVSMMTTANILYRNFQPIMTDNEFDILQDYISSKYPGNASLHDVGAPVGKNKATLPYYMGSMDKIKPETDALMNWTKKYKGPYVLSCKLDGVSGLYTTEGKEAKLYTRGDGKTGQDISHLIPHLRLPKTKNVVIRGEFIMLKSVFEAKYKSQFANPRNLVAGIINHKTVDDKIKNKDVHFVAYELIQPEMTPSKQMEYLKGLNIECVMNLRVDTISNGLLSELLINWRMDYEYEIDGVIVADDKIYERTSGNPSHAFAFKMVLTEQIAEAKVVDVIWNPSKDGYLKPRVQIEPIQLSGVKIEYATGFNAAFIEENNIGIGALVEIIRSGDVIPHIRKVVVPAQEPKMPSVPYEWNATHVDVMLENKDDNAIVKEKNITGFFRGIGVEGLSSGNINRIIHTGYDSVEKIINMTINDFLKVEGFKLKLATKIHDGIREKLQQANIVTLMSASNIFGRGFSDKKLELIMDEYPDTLLTQDDKKTLISKIAAIKGMGGKSAELFVEGIVKFRDFMKNAGLNDKVDKIYENENENLKYDETHPLFSKTIVLSGFRDEKLQNELLKIGAKLGSTVSKKTFVLIVKDKEDETGKFMEAKKAGVTILTVDEFNKTYLK